MSTLDDERKAGDAIPAEPKSKTPVEKPAPSPVLTRMSTVMREEIVWLMDEWIPRGTLVVLDGDPGLGKSTVTIDIAARVSRGWQMPPLGGPHPGRLGASVLLLSAEDHPGQTIRPRLEAAGANLERVHLLDAVDVGQEQRPPVLPWDLELVAEKAEAWNVSLIVIDPFSAFLASEFDAHKDQDIRRCLHTLDRFARRLGVAILLVRHLNKMNGGPALYRGGGSIAITGAARAAMVVGRDPNDECRKILAMNKINLGPMPKSLAYRLEGTESGATRIAWEPGTNDLRPEDILWHAQGKQPERPARPGRASRSAPQRDAAESFLTEFLAKGPVAVLELQDNAKASGFSWRTVQNARANLRIRAYKDGTSWFWELSND